MTYCWTSGYHIISFYELYKFEVKIFNLIDNYEIHDELLGPVALKRYILKRIIPKIEIK